MAKIISGMMTGATGKVGNVVYYQKNGKTVARQMSAATYNSKTVQQILQRVIIKTVAANYSRMKDIADHAFEGVKKGADSMARFQSLNAQYFRDRAAEIVNQGMSLDAFVQFTKLGSKKFTPAAIYLSEGTLTQIHPGITAYTGAGSAIATLDVPANSYAALANQYNLRRGDQVTLVTVEKDSYGEYLFKYSRIILDPRTADGDAAPMSSPLIVDGAVGTPSRRNQGIYYYLAYNDAAKQLRWKHINGDVCAVGVIASRKSSTSSWFRSTCKLVLSEEVLGSDKCSLYSAIYAAQSGTTEVYVDDADALYLNNAGTGGSQGSSSASASDTPVSTELELSDIVEFAGVSQSVAGGSVNASVTEDEPFVIRLMGRNMTDENIADITATVNNQPDAEITRERRADGTALLLTFENVTYPALIRVLNNGGVWFNVNASVGSEEITVGGGDEG